MGLPPRLGLGAGLLEVDHGIDVIDPRQRNEMVLATGIRVVLCKLHLVSPFQVIHGADVHAVRAEHFHVFLIITGATMCFSIALVDNSRQWLVVPDLLQPTEPAIGADMRRTKLLPNPHPGEILAEESLK